MWQLVFMAELNDLVVRIFVASNAVRALMLLCS